MHRTTPQAPANAAPGLGQRLAAVAALVATPLAAYFLARTAWGRGQEVWAEVSHLSLTLPSSLTLGGFLAPVAATVGALVATYLTLVTVVMVLTPGRSRLRARVASLTPAGWRRLVSIAATGTLSASLALPAMASVDVADAGWVAQPTAATAPTHEAPPPAASAPEPVLSPAPGSSPADSFAPASAASAHGAEDDSSEQIVVKAGDTLWDLTAAAQGLPADDHAGIAAAWPELYEANRDVIGTDPDLIVADLRLTVPTEWTS